MASSPIDILMHIAKSNCTLTKSDTWLYKKNINSIECFSTSGKTIAIKPSLEPDITYYVLSELLEGPKKYKDLKISIERHIFSSESLIIAIAKLLEIKLIRVTFTEESDKDFIDFDPIDLERYKWLLEHFSYIEKPSLSKHSMLKKLKQANVCLIGLGGLGSVVAQLLVSSGVIKLTLIDGDIVEASNLSRQIFYTPKDIGQKKTLALKKVLNAYEPKADIKTLELFIDSQDLADTLLKSFDIVILCADEPRLLLHSWIGEASIRNNFPYIAMGSNWVGPISIPLQSPCYICQARYHRAKMADYDGFVKLTIQSEVPPRAAFGPGPVLVGAMMSAMVIEYLSGINRTTHTFTRYRYNIWNEANSEELVRYKNCSRCSPQHNVKS